MRETRLHLVLVECPLAGRVVLGGFVGLDRWVSNGGEGAGWVNVFIRLFI